MQTKQNGSMLEKEQIRQVFTTTDYFMFKSINGNRELNQLHLNRLRQSIAKLYLFTVLIVNEFYQIIDGQHRFECLKEMELPINYVICEGYGLNEVHVLNQNSKTWNSDDYMNGYCELGNKDYIAYRNFKEKYNLPHNPCMILLMGGDNGDLIKLFASGQFKINGLSKANKIAEMIEKISAYYQGAKRRSFIYALIEVSEHQNFNFDIFLSKLRTFPHLMQDYNKKEDYVNAFEKLINYHSKIKVGLKY